MATVRKRVCIVDSATEDVEEVEVLEEPSSLTILKRGLETPADVFEYALATNRDLLEGLITPEQAHAAARMLANGIAVLKIHMRTGGRPLLTGKE